MQMPQWSKEAASGSTPCIDSLSHVHLFGSLAAIKLLVASMEKFSDRPFE